MQKAKLGISVGLLGAAIYLTALSGSLLGLLVLAGYVLLVEDNQWLRLSAVKAVAEALGDTGRILVRESGTEPVVRVMVEAPDHNTCQKYVDEVVNVICEKGYLQC